MICRLSISLTVKLHFHSNPIKHVSAKNLAEEEKLEFHTLMLTFFENLTLWCLFLRFLLQTRCSRQDVAHRFMAPLHQRGPPKKNPKINTVGGRTEQNRSFQGSEAKLSQPLTHLPVIYYNVFTLRSARVHVQHVCSRPPGREVLKNVFDTFWTCLARPDSLWSALRLWVFMKAELTELWDL